MGPGSGVDRGHTGLPRGPRLRPHGGCYLTTPNRLTSDGVNPFHVHEYVAEELAALLERHFARVEMLGVNASPPVAEFFEARKRRIERILRWDPLRFRDRLPRNLINWLFGRFAILVRRSLAQQDQLPTPTWRDFPIGPATNQCLDLLAICLSPR